MNRFSLLIFALSVSGLPLCGFMQGGSSLMAQTTDYYPVNIDKSTTLSRSDRYTNTIGLNSSSDGQQSISVGQQTSRLVYIEVLDKAFTAKAGESVSASLGYTPGTWMHGYVYIDRGQDGAFSYDLNDSGTPADGSDLVSFSYYNGVNSLGTTANAGSSIQPPAFTVPAELAPGFYRLRYKVDWDNVDPGGSTVSGNTITANGGVIVDTRLNVHGDNVAIYCASEADGTGNANGKIVKADGSDLTTEQIPFGQPYAIRYEPAQGYDLSCIVMRHGYNLEGDSLVCGTAQYEDIIIPAYLFQDKVFTIPANLVDGDIRITPYFSATSGGQGGATEDYPTNFDKATLDITNTDNTLSNFVLSATNGGTTTVAIPSTADKVYNDMTAKEVSVVPGDDIATTINYTGSMHAYLYVDYNQDGAFGVALNADGSVSYSSELVAYTYCDGRNSLGEAVGEDVATSSMPSFSISSMLPTGVYRARLKVDWNNSDPGGSATIGENGGYVVDFLINVHNPENELRTYVGNGSVNNGSSLTNTTGLPDTTPAFTALRLRMSPITDDYTTDKITVRHGHLNRPQYVHGNRQWSEYTIDYANIFNIPADSVNGDVIISADFQPSDAAEYKLVFSDEFDGEDGSMPDPTKWGRCIRYSSAWNRFLSKTEEEHELTGFVEDGKFVARCLPNPYQDTDDVAMISGGISTSDIFSFTYGKLEARILTNPYSGNFPAFWMMPQDNSAGWPYGGEIDIWEQINSENTSWHTIHSRWANSTSDGSLCQGQSSNPTKAGSNSNTTAGNYHTFGLEWTDTKLTWYVDGVQVFSYAKLANNAEALELGQWPFDKPFYIILNQSVGNGSWAAAADVTHTYETLFDWVRVYQKNASTDGIVTTRANGQAVDVTTSRGTIRVVAEQETPVTIADIAGRVVFKGKLQGNKSLNVQTGVYIVNGKKVLVP